MADLHARVTGKEIPAPQYGSMMVRWGRSSGRLASALMRCGMELRNRARAVSERGVGGVGLRGLGVLRLQLSRLGSTVMLLGPPQGQGTEIVCDEDEIRPTDGSH